MAWMVRCERCGRENDPSLFRCLDCGEPLTRPPARPATPLAASASCGRCGAPRLPSFRFCAQCGAELPVPSAAEVQPAPPPAGKAPRLCSVRTDGSRGPAYPLSAPTCLCGRLEGEILIDDDPTVSPRHASFTVRGSQVTVQDLGSVNGTFLRIRAPHPLAPGEEFRLGRQLLRVEPLPRPAQDAGVGRSWGGADAGCRLRLAQLLEGGGLGEIHPLQPGENLIGREAGQVTFPGDRYVSARHARIDLAGDAITITDLNSSNGTFRRLSGPTPLSAGDQLLIGGKLLKLEV